MRQLTAKVTGGAGFLQMNSCTSIFKKSLATVSTGYFHEHVLFGATCF